MKWIVTHANHKLPIGEVYDGDELPKWLVGKARLVSEEEKVFEVATPQEKKTKVKK